MATRTNFSRNKLSDILSSYSLGELIDSQSFTTGTVQTNLRLQTTTGDYVFRYYEQCRSQDSVLFEVHLMRYLKQRHYPCPAPFNNKSGQIVGLYNNRPYVIFEFIEGDHLENPNEAQKKNLLEWLPSCIILRKATDHSIKTIDGTIALTFVGIWPKKRQRK